MKKLLLTSFLIILFTVFLVKSARDANEINQKEKEKRVWSVKSVDTMKYSRDLAEEKLNDPSFDQVIEKHVQTIADTGANVIAIATPYDEKYFPFLNRWVTAARKHYLKIWFKGNFSAWEGWFNTPRDLTREQHIDLTKNFIRNHPDLFKKGDIFSPCPECENGGPGDPRKIDTQDYRDFIVTEYAITKVEMKKIDKEVLILFPMNFDVAKLVLNEKVIKFMDNFVAIDHYVKTPQKLSNDLDDLSNKTGAEIIIGEIGAPVPDIHGEMTDEQQSEWLSESLQIIAKKQNVIGINYWVSYGGSTAIFYDKGGQKPAAKVLEKYFKLPFLPSGN